MELPLRQAHAQVATALAAAERVTIIEAPREQFDDPAWMREILGADHHDDEPEEPQARP